MTAPAWFPDDPDLPWTAFRYIAGELPPEEAAAFEARLGDDQAAREAVAAAVELAGAVALLGPVETIPMRPRRRVTRATAWVATGIAAGLLLGFGLDRLVLHPPATLGPRMAEEVVFTWSNLRRQTTESDPLAYQLALNDEPADPGMDSGGDEEVPSWMAELATLPSINATPRTEN